MTTLATLTKPEVAPSTAYGARPPQRTPLWAKAVRNVAWTAVTAVAVVAAVEGLLALNHVGEEEFVDIQPTIGFWHIPNKLITWRSEGYSQSRNSSAGLRDQEYTIQKPAGVKRIAVVGDSMTEAYQVNPDQTFIKLLESKFLADGQKVQVMNFGMSAHSTPQTLYLFKERIAQYKPDLCVLAYHIGDNEKNVYTPGADAFLPRPYCSLTADGVLKSDWHCYDNWMKNKYTAFTNLNWLRNNSRIFGLLTSMDLQCGMNPIYAKLKSTISSLSEPKKQANPEPPRIANTSEELGLPVSKFDTTLTGLPSFVSHLEPLPPTLTGKRLKEATENRNVGIGWHAILHASNQRFQVTGALLDTFAKLCAKEQCQFAVAALPAPNNSMLYFRELDAMQKLAPRSGFKFIDVNAGFPSIAPMETSDLYYNVHFTPKGHALVADILYKQLRSD